MFLSAHMQLPQCADIGGSALVRLVLSILPHNTHRTLPENHLQPAMNTAWANHPPNVCILHISIPTESLLERTTNGPRPDVQRCVENSHPLVIWMLQQLAPNSIPTMRRHSLGNTRTTRGCVVCNQISWINVTAYYNKELRSPSQSFRQLIETVFSSVVGNSHVGFTF